MADPKKTIPQLDAITTAADGSLLILHDGNGTKKISVADFLASVGYVKVGNGAGQHNAIYRGKNLGTSVTDAQFTAIRNGTFDDMFIGDYWVTGGRNWRIAAFDYYWQTGDTPCNTHHVTLVPDASLYTHCMNDTNTTEGAYVGSKMYTEGLDSAKDTIKAAFGENHILTHRQYLQNATTNGYASNGAWFDSQVELMTEQNVYGGLIFTPTTAVMKTTGDSTIIPNNYTVDKSQYPLFALNPNMISNRIWYWLRNVVSASIFAYVNGTGFADYGNASYAGNVRPAFSIIG